MKFRYIIFKDAPHLKTSGQPDEMIAQIFPMAENEQAPPAPWVVATDTQVAEYTNSISSILMAWQKTQPYLVEVEAGQRQERILIDGQLKPRPSLEPNNS